MKLLIVGNPDPTHVGGHFLRAAEGLGWNVSLLNANDAYAGPLWIKRVCWHLLKRRPLRLGRFSDDVVARSRVERPDLVLTTGIAPLSALAIQKLRAMQIKVANFLTDDPWNRHHHTPTFLNALPAYDHVFTPRRANMGDIRSLLGPQVHYLPFAYAPEIHYPPPLTASVTDAGKWQSDVLFVGGADEDRAETVRALIARGLRPSLWGGYWDRFPEFRPYAHGHAGPDELRHLVSFASVNLCVVRRANRDGHSMRTFELAAIGGCLAVEDTGEQREIFGAEGECVSYFADHDSLAAVCRRLLSQPDERDRLRTAVRERVTMGGHHTYAARLRAVREACLNEPEKTLM